MKKQGVKMGKELAKVAKWLIKDRHARAGLFGDRLIIIGSGQLDVKVEVEGERGSWPLLFVQSSVAAEIAATGKVRLTEHEGQKLALAGKAASVVGEWLGESVGTIPQRALAHGCPLWLRVLGEKWKWLAKAASREEYRAIFRGVQIWFRDEDTRIAVSDGYRLHELVLPAVAPDSYAGSHLLKRVFVLHREVPVDAIAKLTTGWRVDDRGEKALLTFALGENAVLELDSMEGTYPDYFRVLPSGEPVLVFEATGDPETLRSLGEVSRKVLEFDNPRVDLVPEGGKVYAVAGPQREEFGRVLHGDILDDKPLAVNGHYLADALEAGRVVKVFWKDGLYGVLVESEKDEVAVRSLLLSLRF
ncbi:MAG: hypothetical protein N2557_07890 [Hydrogenophilus sp.]|nr:hypothetical protein [Hydrogenophilus sp.]